MAFEVMTHQWKGFSWTS